MAAFISQSRSPRVHEQAPFDDVLAGARAGAAWAYRSLFDQLGPAVAGYFRGQRADDPDDLANEVFLRAFKAVERFEGDEAHFRSWIFALAHNAMVDDRRRRARRVIAVEFTDRAHVVTGGDVEQEAWQVLESDEVHRLVSMLTDEQREVILLRVVAALSVAQVATILHRNPAAIRALQHRGLKSIRRSLGI